MTLTLLCCSAIGCCRKRIAIRTLGRDGGEHVQQRPLVIEQMHVAPSKEAGQSRYPVAIDRPFCIVYRPKKQEPPSLDPRRIRRGSPAVPQLH